MAPVYIRLHDGPDSKKGQDLIPDLQLVLVVSLLGTRVGMYFGG